ncbi:MAG: hypothetical protein ACE5HS_08190 [bacterium]
MKINVRWLIQALAFIGCIFSFIQIWERSKNIFHVQMKVDFIGLSLFGALFLLCFLVMAITSYLKQKTNGTLRNPIPLFEKVLAKFGWA